MTHIRGLLVVLSDFLHRCHPYAVLFIPVLSVFLHRCHPYGVGFVVVVVFLHRCHPYAVLLWCYPLFYIDTTPTGFYGAGTYIFYIDDTHTGFACGVIRFSTQISPLRGSIYSGVIGVSYDEKYVFDPGADDTTL